MTLKEAFYAHFAGVPATPVQAQAKPVPAKLETTAALAAFYQAALLNTPSKGGAESAQAAQDGDRILDGAETAAAPAAAGVVVAEATVVANSPVLLASNHTAPATSAAAPKPAAAAAGRKPTTAEEEDTDWGFIGAGFLLGALAGNAGGDDDNSRPEPVVVEDHCAIDFVFPDKPTGATVKSIEVAAGVDETQASGETFEIAEGETLVVDVGTLATLSGIAGDFLVNASGNMGDLYATFGNSASANLDVTVAGGIGNIAVFFGNDTEYRIDVDVRANGDVGNVTLGAAGGDAGGSFSLDTTGGDVGRVDMVYANPESYDRYSYISAYAELSGSTLVGGNIGDVRVVAEGVRGKAELDLLASGGNIGDLEVIACGGSAEADLSAYTQAQIDGNGLAVGGNVGDLVVVADGASADTWVDIHASGIVSSSGQYLGGGNIGNLELSTTGSNAEARVYLRAFSGGSIGNISVQVCSPEDISDSYSASADVNASAYGDGGQVASIGDVTVDIYGGINNSGYLNLHAYSGGDIGTVAVTASGGVSGEIDIFIRAFANADDEGGNIGDVSLTNTSWAGDTSGTLQADNSMGDVTATLGGGSANLRMNVVAAEDATVGNITVDLASDHYGSGGYVRLALEAGVTVGDITVTGGSEFSTFEIAANTAFFPYTDWTSKVAADVDMTGFLGFSTIDLRTAENSVSIKTGQGGSLVHGTLAADTIALGAGSDTVNFANVDLAALVSPTDTITDFDAVADVADVTDVFDKLAVLSVGGTFSELTSNSALTLADNDVISLIDLAAGEDLSAEAGLLTALNSGEYDLVDGVLGDFTFVTATGTSATSFNLFHVQHDGTAFTSVDKMAVVTMATGSTFGDLSTSHFVVI